MNFRIWFNMVNATFTERYGVSLRDMEDIDYRSIYEESAICYAESERDLTDIISEDVDIIADDLDMYAYGSYLSNF